jgi:AraC family ethanolamine operon transcriptional activator
VFSETNIGFDSYADSVREADAGFLLAGPSVLNWHVAQCALNRIVLQFGSAGGGTIAYGRTRPDAVVFVMQKTEFKETSIFNGQMTEPYDIAVLTPSSDYTFASLGPHQWLSISVPIDLGPSITAANRASVFPSKTMHVTSEQELTRDLTAAVIEQALEFRDSDEAVCSFSRDQVVLNALIRAVNASSLRKASVRVVRTERMILEALQFIEKRTDEIIRVGDVSDFVGMKERTFRRLFYSYFGVSPIQYLKLRQLNMVRRAIRLAQNSDGVTKILSTHGVTEFGRFSGEYKALFGESPSETAKTGLPLVVDEPEAITDPSQVSRKTPRRSALPS